MEKKLLRITDDIAKIMDFEEALRFYKKICDNQAYRFSKVYELQELQQEAYIGLWKAFQKYENTEIRFGAWATVFIKRALLKYHAKNRSKCSLKTSRISSVISLFQPLNNGRGETFEIADLVGEPESFSEAVADRIMVEKSMKRLNSLEKEMIMRFASGYQLGEMSKASNSSYRLIQNRISRARDKFRIQ